ncbi:MAG: hypothetical protein H7A37_01175 [Chlamydiales bacterium]|nr:hypothetical protein [Chlamydiia bacterium]MCP5506905.1 hypothetical protein [Chlamydiales bacterium]
MGKTAYVHGRISGDQFSNLLISNGTGPIKAPSGTTTGLNIDENGNRTYQSGAAGRHYKIQTDRFKASDIVTKPIATVAEVFTPTKGADKIVKLGKDIGNISVQSFEVAGAAGTAGHTIAKGFGATAGGFCKVVTGLNFFLNIHTLIKGRNTMNWAEKTSLSGVVVADALKTGVFVWRDLHLGDVVVNGLNFLLKAAKVSAQVGNVVKVLPFVEQAANAILIPASVFGIVGESLKLAKVDKLTKEAVKKQGKWGARINITLDELKNHYQSKINSHVPGTLSDKKIDKWNNYKKLLDDAGIDGNAKVQVFRDRAAKKVIGWSEYTAAAKHNATKEKVVSALGIVDYVMKVALGVIGITMFIIGMCTGMVFPAIGIALATGWLIDHSVALSKFLVKTFYTEASMEKPSLSVVQELALLPRITPNAA